MLQLAIIADDLTGALDAAAPFAGIPGGVAVAIRPEALDAALLSGAGVVSVSTRSREIPADEARARVAAAMASLPVGLRLFKKIDSRLKGNIEAELRPFGPARMLVSPAIPDLGRGVLDGHLHGTGVASPIFVRSKLGDAGDFADIPEVTRQADLVAAVRRADSDVVLVGARGMAQALARSMGVPPAPTLTALPKPFCIAVGSTDPITLKQVAALKLARPDLHIVEAPSGNLCPPDGLPAPLTLLQLVPGADRTAKDAAHGFANGAAAWLRAARSLLLTGGATAEVLLDTLQIDMLTVEGEILPGMPYCRSGERVVITKSGGFGDADALVHLAALNRAGFAGD